MYDCVIYVAGPYTGNVEQNVATARVFSTRLWEMGFPNICPHQNSYKGAALEHNYLNGYAVMVTRADIVLLLPFWEKSNGTSMELKALRHRAPKTPIYEWEALDNLVVHAANTFSWLEEEKSPRLEEPDVSILKQLAVELVATMRAALEARPSSFQYLGGTDPL